MQATRPLIFVAVILALLISACSQVSEDLTTPTLDPQFGTVGFDSVDDVAYGKAGYLYAVGTWNNSYQNLPNREQQAIYQDAYLRRYDRSGNLVWEDFLEVEQAYEDSYRIISAPAVTTDGSGNAIVAWSALYYDYAYNSDTGFYEFQEAGRFNYLSKYTLGGKKLWRISVSGNPINDLATDSSGNIYATAVNTLAKYTASGARSWTRTMLVEPTGVAVSRTNNVYIVRQDGFVIKFNSGGTQLFAKTNALDGYGAEGYKIATGLNDELFITGQDVISSRSSCEATNTTTRYNMRVYKLNASGVRQWYKDAATGTYVDAPCTFGGPYEDEITGTPGNLNVATDSTGNVYLAGFRNSTTGDQDAFAAKYTRAGALSWVKGFGTASDDGATSIATCDGTEVFVGGTTKGYLVHRQLGQGDAFLREMNSSGNRVWTR